VLAKNGGLDGRVRQRHCRRADEYAHTITDAEHRIIAVGTRTHEQLHEAMQPHVVRRSRTEDIRANQVAHHGVIAERVAHHGHDFHEIVEPERRDDHDRLRCVSARYRAPAASSAAARNASW
jgi:hypothetical protein